MAMVKIVWSLQLHAFINVYLIAKFMHQNQQKLKQQQLKHQKVQDVLDVVVQSLLLNKCCQKDVHGILNVTIVMNVQKR